MPHESAGRADDAVLVPSTPAEGTNNGTTVGNEQNSLIVGFNGRNIPPKGAHRVFSRKNVNSASTGRRKKEEGKRTGEESTSLSDLISSEADADCGSSETSLSHFIPEAVADAYAKDGIKNLYHWQVEALSIDEGAPLSGKKNLVYQAATSAGKSLVAELLVLRTVERGLKGLFIFPYVSLTMEKLHTLKDKWEGHASFPVKLQGFYGSVGGNYLNRKVDVVLATIEKANALLNRLIEDDRLKELGAVVVDELHTIGEGRGHLVEMILSKLRYLASNSVQIIGLSATLPEISKFGTWLDASTYATDFRPVPLRNFIYCEETNQMLELPCPAEEFASKARRKGHEWTCLVDEVTDAGHSVLVFCPSKAWCQSCATRLATRLKSQKWKDERRGHLVEELKLLPTGICSVLRSTVPYGVAYHHSGLSVEEREVVERGFRQGIIKVLCATTTLGAGVNLPSRRVIVRSCKMGSAPLGVTRYLQMAGRAGRTGQGDKGEAIVICEAMRDVGRTIALTASPLPPLNSRLGGAEEFALHRLILEGIVTVIVDSKATVLAFCRGTLFAALTSDESLIEAKIEEALTYLEEHQFIQRDKDKLNSTALGQAAFYANMDIQMVGEVVDDLTRLREGGACLETDLHLIYHVTPRFESAWVDWVMFRDLLDALPEAKRRVADVIGLDYTLLHNKLARGHTKTKSSDQSVRRLRRFRNSLALYELIEEEKPLRDVAKKFKLTRGDLQRLQSDAATFVGMVTAICHHLNWSLLEVLFANFKDRLTHGVRDELLSLVQIKGMKAFRARALFKEGFQTAKAVARADVDDIYKIVVAAVPYRRTGEVTEFVDSFMRRTAHSIIEGAKEVVQRMNKLKKQKKKAGVLEAIQRKAEKA